MEVTLGPLRIPAQRGWIVVSVREATTTLRHADGDAVRFIEPLRRGDDSPREAFDRLVGTRGADIANLRIPEPVIVYAPAHFALLGDIDAAGYRHSFVVIDVRTARLAVVQIARAAVAAARTAELRAWLRDITVDEPDEPFAAWRD